GAIGLGIGPVEVMVVDESAIEDDAIMWRESGGEGVGGISGGTSVARRAGLAFGVCFDGEPAEVGNEGVDLVDLVVPPFSYCGIEGVKGGEPAEFLRAGDVGGEGDTDTVGAHRVGNTGD